jgi:hypothetical protein
MARKNVKTKEAPRKAPQRAVKAQRTFGLGERDPHKMSAESAADNARGTRKWNYLLKLAQTPGGLTGAKYTGH